MASPLLLSQLAEELMENKGYNNEESQKNTENKKQNSSVEQVRGPELGQKMKESEELGDQYRAEHQGADVRKQPGTSNSEKPHQH